MKSPATLSNKLGTIDSARLWLYRADQALREPEPDVDGAIKALELAEQEIGHVLKALRAHGADRRMLRCEGQR